MATMTFQNGGYFPFKVKVKTGKRVRLPHFLFHEMIPFSFLKYLPCTGA